MIGQVRFKPTAPRKSKIPPKTFRDFARGLCADGTEGKDDRELQKAAAQDEE